MQTLSFLGAGRILTKWAAGLYRSIAAIYTDMLNLVDTFNDSPLAEALNNISANVYVLVGVFMLFRIGVSLLNYLVDPSKLDDKKVGGGQLVTHILISIVLLLSLNFVFKWTNDLQTILLERDGILYKIISTGNAEMSKLNDLQLINTQEVSVVSKKYKDNENICNNTATIKAALKEHIINNIRDGCFTKKYTRAEAEKLVNSVPITYNSSGRELTGISGSIDETSLKGLNTKVSVKYKNQVGQSVSGVKPNFHLTNATCYFNFPLSRDYSDNSLDSISGFHVEYYCDSSKSDEVEKSIEGIENKKEQQIRKDQGKYDNSSIEESGFEFATITLSTFMSPSDEVDDTILKQYSGEKSSDWWADRIEDEQKSSSGITYSMDWLLAFICGLAIIAALLAIMMEVVVRNLKLVFLQAIAPVPVVSYMNPNDKLLDTWVKQYIGVYFSLFIQLFVILIIPDLMMKLLDSVTGGFILKIVIIAGCLLFTKEAPKFIGKLLGLDNMEGSFGDAFKMVKTGLGIGAGAAAGAVAGAFTGAGAGGSLSTFMGGMLGGAFRGASSGSQGKIFEGAGKQIARNKKVRDMNLNGYNWSQRMLSKVGLDAESRAQGDLKRLQNEQKAYQDFNQHKKNIEDLADSSDFMKDLRNQRNADGSQKYTEEQLKRARTSWISAQRQIASGVVRTGSVTVGGQTYSVSEEKGKWSGIKTELEVAEIERSNSSLLQGLSSGATPITDFAALDAIDKDAKTANNGLTIEISKIASDPAFKAAQASHDSKQ